MTPTCPDCQTELDEDGNCPTCTERMNETVTTVLGDESYQEPDDLAECYQNRELRILL